MNRLLPIVFVLLTGLFASLHAHAQSLATPVDSIVAVVEEDVILRSELDRALNAILAQYAGRSQQLPPRDVLEKQVLERLVVLRLQLQRAQSAGIRVTDIEVDQALGRIAQQNRVSMEQMREQLARDGLPFDVFRQTIRDEMIAQRLRQNVVQSRVTVTDTEIDILLASNSMKKGQVKASLILIGIPENATQQQIDTARAKADGVRALIEKGELDFRSAAIRYSDHQSALEGGEMGWRNFDELPPLFSNLLQGMKKGEVSPPVRGPAGFQLVELTDTREQTSETITEYNARDIMIRTSELVDQDAARAKLEAIRARIVAGEDFAKLASELSEDTLTRGQGGDMGWFQLQAWGGAVAERISKLKDGELSDVFVSEAGAHLIERLGSRVQDVTVESQRNRARETVARRKSEEEFERFVRQLRDEAYVETRLGKS